MAMYNYLRTTATNQNNFTKILRVDKYGKGLATAQIRICVTIYYIMYRKVNVKEKAIPVAGREGP
jgi:hypothetical protein